VAAGEGGEDTAVAELIIPPLPARGAYNSLPPDRSSAKFSVKYPGVPKRPCCIPQRVKSKALFRAEEDYLNRRISAAGPRARCIAESAGVVVTVVNHLGGEERLGAPAARTPASQLANCLHMTSPCDISN